MSDPATIRIIAADADLNATDRAALIEAADDLESSWRTLYKTQLDLNEALRQQMATRDRLLETQAMLKLQLMWPSPFFWCVHLEQTNG